MENKTLFENIIKWQVEHIGLRSNCLKGPVDAELVSRIEKLLGEAFPEDLLELYAYANGEVEDTSVYTFLGLTFMDSQQIIDHIHFCKRLIKGAYKASSSSEPIIKEIVAFYRKYTPLKSLFGFTKKWYKINAKLGLGTFEGPYLYKKKSSSKSDKIPVRIKDYSPISNAISKIHGLENNSWDLLDITIYADGSHKVERKTHTYETPRSNPLGKIKKINFYAKWIPFLHDSTGNYIAYDLDPDHHGNKGQIIMYGKDEYENHLIANSLNDFLELVYNELSISGEKNLINEVHLFENLKKIRKL